MHACTEDEMDQYGPEVVRMNNLPRNGESEDLADEYSVRVCEKCDSGIIVFGKFRNKWHPNPSLRPVVAELIRRSGICVPIQS